MSIKGKRIGFGLTGSHCTYAKSRINVLGVIRERTCLSRIRLGMVLMQMSIFSTCSASSFVWKGVRPTRPGGTDFDFAEKQGIKALLAPGLPGIVAPKTAGQIIANVLCNLLSELTTDRKGLS